MKQTMICGISALVSFLPTYGANRTSNYRTVNRVQYGVASWYGRREQGRLMACGIPFNRYAMVAANRTLPLGSEVQVTNLRNGRSVVVRIMDRGPYIAGRVIDLSEGAAERLGFINQGITSVRIRVLTIPLPPRNSRKQSNLPDTRWSHSCPARLALITRRRHGN